MNYYTRKEIKIIQKKLENLFKHITKKNIIKKYLLTITNIVFISINANIVFISIS